MPRTCNWRGANPPPIPPSHMVGWICAHLSCECSFTVIRVQLKKTWDFMNLDLAGRMFPPHQIVKLENASTVRLVRLVEGLVDLQCLATCTDAATSWGADKRKEGANRSNRARDGADRGRGNREDRGNRGDREKGTARPFEVTQAASSCMVPTAKVYQGVLTCANVFSETQGLCVAWW